MVRRMPLPGFKTTKAGLETRQQARTTPLGGGASGVLLRHAYPAQHEEIVGALDQFDPVARRPDQRFGI